MREEYLDMTDDELIKALKDYAFANAETIGGDLTYAASIRIAVLTARAPAEQEGK